MNPIMKCCGYYCSCIIVVSFFFYAILIYLIESKNWWVIRDFPHDTDSKVKSIYIAMAVNAVCLVGCIGCLMQGQAEEKRAAEEAERREEEKFGELKHSQ